MHSHACKIFYRYSNVDNMLQNVENQFLRTSTKNLPPLTCYTILNMEKLKHNVFFKTIRILRNDWHRFEYDPQTQLKYHRRMIIFWLNNFLPMNVIVGVDIWATLSGHDKIALLMTAILLAINTNYSLYANFDTETGDAHAAYASVQTDEIKAAQAQPPINQDIIDESKQELEEFSL